jgi:hypothetical protein
MNGARVGIFKQENRQFVADLISLPHQRRVLSPGTVPKYRSSSDIFFNELLSPQVPSVLLPVS